MATNGKKRTLVCIALVLGVALLFAPTLGHGFVDYDDGDYVYKNPAVQGGLTAEGVSWAFSAYHSGNWHPLTWISHMVDVELFGLDAGGHHGTNVLLHALNAVLVFTLLLRTTGRFGAAAAVAALFAVHPLRVESVAWVAERKDLLVAAFGLGTLHAWVGFARSPSLPRYLLALALFAAGLLCKPMLVTWPCVLLLFDVWPLGRWREPGPGRLLAEKLPFLLLTIGSAWVTVRAQESGGAVTWFGELPLDVRVANALAAYASYVELHFVPAGLAVFYPHPAAIPGATPPGFGAATLIYVAVLVAALVLAVRLRARAGWFAFGWLFFLGTLVPVIGLFQVGAQSHADRYAYLPTLGLHILVVFACVEFVSGTLRRALPAGLVVALLALGWVTHKQIGHWRDTVTLFERALAVTEENFLAHYNLGTALLEREDFEGAEEHFRASLAIQPANPLAWNGVGMSLVRRGRPLEAETAFRSALRVNGNDVDALINLAGVMASKGSEGDAVAFLERALTIDPLNAGALRNRGLSLYRLGRRAEAKASLIDSFALETPDANYADLLAWILAVSPESSVRDGELALRWVRHALSVGGQNNPKHLDTLAAVEAERGNFAAAVQAQERAFPGMPPGLRSAGEARLQLYRSGQPFRSSAGNDR